MYEVYLQYNDTVSLVCIDAEKIYSWSSYIHPDIARVSFFWIKLFQFELSAGQLLYNQLIV